MFMLYVQKLTSDPYFMFYWMKEFTCRSKGSSRSPLLLSGGTRDVGEGGGSFGCPCSALEVGVGLCHGEVLHVEELAVD